MTAKSSNRPARKPVPKVVLSPVVRCEMPGPLAVPNELSLGNDGRLYLGRSGEGPGAKPTLQPASLKESFAWFRVGHECGLKHNYGDSFGAWLRMIEKVLP